MALVMISGFPGAGKSTRAREIAQMFEERLTDSPIKEIHIVDDETLGIAKSDYYDRETEKRARGKQMSAIKRLVGPNALVILDNLTYIKGFRYQLHCEAKAAQITSCVVHVGTPAEIAAEFNRSRSDTDAVTPWPTDLFDALVFRYEEPNGMQRWDSPLFVVTPGDELPVSELWDALVVRKPMKPNAATQKNGVIGADYLTELNGQTSNIVREMLNLHARNPGSEVTLHGQRVQLPYNLTMAQLSRIRRNFISVNKSTTTSSENIASYFIEFLQKNWDVTS